MTFPSTVLAVCARTRRWQRLQLTCRSPAQESVFDRHCRANDLGFSSEGPPERFRRPDRGPATSSQIATAL